MILVDTSVWIDHFRKGSAELERLIDKSQVLIHPFIICELAFGNLGARAHILELLGQLPRAPLASHDEVLHYIERRSLMGRGIGFVDAHLLASVSLGDGLALWTLDKRLQSVAADLIAR